MAKTIFSIYSTCTMGCEHQDCLMLVNAETKQEAIERALNETTITDVFEESNLDAESLPLTAENEEYIHIFADDVYYI